VNQERKKESKNEIPMPVAKRKPILSESSEPKDENIRHIYRQLKGARKGTDREKENTRQFIENMKQKKDFSSIPTNDFTNVTNLGYFFQPCPIHPISRWHLKSKHRPPIKLY
jgi:hypothetical protein